MNGLSKLSRLLLVIAISTSLTGCNWFSFLTPKHDNCQALFRNAAATRVTLVLDGSIIFQGNFLPGDHWVKMHLEDGTRHTFRAYAADPSVFDTGTRTFRAEMGHTHTYDGVNYNAVIEIGGSVHDALTPADPDTQ